MFAAAQWAADRRYLAEVCRVVQAGDTAAVVVDWSLTGRGSVDSRGERGRGWMSYAAGATARGGT